VLFDAAVNPLREQEIAEIGLEVVARPGMAAPERHVPGLFAISRGEGRLAVVSAVERVVPGRAVLEAEGIPCEGHADGVFIEVDGAAGGRRGLRISDPQRRMARHVVLLRERSAAPPGATPTRERLFEADAESPAPWTAPAVPSAASEAGDATQDRTAAGASGNDPIPPPRPALAMTGTVGRSGPNNPADLRAAPDHSVHPRPPA